MCQAFTRGKRGGRIRRINVILSNRAFSKPEVLKGPDRSNLLSVPLTNNNDPGQIEVIISNEISAVDRKTKQTFCNVGENNIQVRLQRQQKELNISVLNVQSACNKADRISDYIVENNSDIVFLGETWISEDNNFTCDQLTPQTHTIHHVPRVGKPGGGVGIISRNLLRAQPITVPRFNAFEHAATRIKAPTTYITAVAVYRPPGHVSEQFFSEFATLLETHALTKDRLIICGDFNIHLDKKSEQTSTKFIGLLRDFGLVQHTHTPTHLSGHTLDLVITRSDDDFIIDSPKTGELFSDHFDVMFRYKLENVAETQSFIKVRKLKQIDIESFKNELGGLNRIDYTAHDLDTLLDAYSATLRHALDKVAPLRTKRIKSQTLKPWIDEEVINERKRRRQLERNMIKNRNCASIENYKTQRNRVNALIDKKKIAFFHSSIKDCAGDQKAIYQIIKKLANKPTTAIYPEAPDDGTLANQFSDFFSNRKLKK